MLLSMVASSLASQVPAPDSTHRPLLEQLVTIGSPAADRLRREQLTGAADLAGSLVQTASSLTPGLGDAGAARPRWSLLLPRVDATWNSTLPFSMNDGALWAGRGTSARVLLGARVRWRRFSLQLAPEVMRVANAPMPLLPSGRPERSTYASPFHSGDLASADLPLRFGSRPFWLTGPGQTTLAADFHFVSAGASTEEQWWGPGTRNALVMSNNAGGVPHLFVRTRAPLRTRFGSIEARWILGGLVESPYFDADGRNDLRSLSGLVVAFRPAAAPDLTIGGTRVVYAYVSDVVEVIPRLFDAPFRWSGFGEVSAADRSGAAEQLFSFFGRWVFPASGVEAYGEWARTDGPKSGRELLTAPQRGAGYTVGLQWLSGAGRPRVRVQAEATNLEQTPRERGDNALSFYTSATVMQGYTHRGQVLGAAIGPGSSSQWLAADLLGGGWRVGVVGARIRWDTDAYYRQITSTSWHAHDVSLMGGLRGGGSLWGSEITLELLTAYRYNYLFQSPVYGYAPDNTFDTSNRTLRVSIAPRAHR